MATQAQMTAPVRGRSFYVAVAVISAMIVFLGFSRTFFFNSYFAKRDLTSLMVFHGIIFSCWLVLLIVQTSLVAADRTDIHRKLGVAGRSSRR